MGKQLRRLKRATKQVFNQKQDKQKYIGGLLGTYIDGVETVKVSDRPGYVYVRLGGSASEVIQAVNGVVKEAFDLKVLVTIHPYNPGIYQIVGIDMGQYRSQTTTAFSLPAHGDSHSLGDGTDPVFIYRKQMRQPLQAHPTTPKGNTLYIEPDFFRWGSTTKFWPGGYTADLTVANPSAGLGRYITVYLAGETNSIGYITGSTFSNITGAITNIPAVNPITQGIPLAAVFLNSITDEIDWDNIVDIRMFLELGGVTVAIHGLDPIHGIHSGTIRSSLSTVVDARNFYTGTVVEDVLQEIGQKALYAVNGTGTANKVAVFHDIDTIKSYTGLNYDGSTLSLGGNLQSTGTGYFHTVRTNSLFISGSNFILESDMDIAPGGAGVGQALVFDGTRWEPGDVAAGTGSAGSTDAIDINISDTGGFYTGTNVEAALQELGNELNTFSQGHEHGITRLNIASGTTNIELLDFAQYLEMASFNGFVLDPLGYSLSSGSNYLVLDSPTVVEGIFTVQYVILSS